MLGPPEYLNPKYEGVYSAPQLPPVGYDPSGIPTNLLSLMYTEYLVIQQKREWLESKNTYYFLNAHIKQHQLLFIILINYYNADHNYLLKLHVVVRQRIDMKSMTKLTG